MPPLAPGVEPVQGASRKSTPLAFSASPILRLSLGLMVLQSATTVPGLAPWISAVLAQDHLLRHGGIADAEEDALGVVPRPRRAWRKPAPFSSAASSRAFSPLFDQSATCVRRGAGCGPWGSPSLRVRESLVLP